MEKESKLLIGISLFILGLIVRNTTLLNIIHEYMHVIFAASEGQFAVSVHQSHTVFEELSPIVVYSGYYGEAMLYGGLTFIIIFIGFKWVAMLPFGIYHVVVFRGYFSRDFRVHALRYFNDQGIVDANLTRWLILSVVALTVLWVMMWKARSYSSIK